MLYPHNDFKCNTYLVFQTTLIVLGVGVCVTQQRNETGLWQVEELNRLWMLFGRWLGTYIDCNNEKSILEDIFWIKMMWI